MFDAHAKQIIWESGFLVEGGLCVNGRKNDATIAKCIRDQETYDQALHNLSGRPVKNKHFLSA